MFECCDAVRALFRLEFFRKNEVDYLMVASFF